MFALVDVRKSQYFPTRNNKFRFLLLCFLLLLLLFIKCFDCGCLSSTICFWPKEAMLLWPKTCRVSFCFFFLPVVHVLPPLIMKQNVASVLESHTHENIAFTWISTFVVDLWSSCLPVHIIFWFSSFFSTSPLLFRFSRLQMQQHFVFVFINYYRNFYIIYLVPFELSFILAGSWML